MLSGCPALVFETTHFGPSEISPVETTYVAFRAPGRLPVLHMGAKHTLVADALLAQFLDELHLAWLGGHD